VFSVNHAARTYQELTKLENYLYTYQMLDTHSTKVSYWVLNLLHEHFIVSNYSPDNVIDEELKPLITQQFEEVLFKFRIIKGMVQLNCEGLLSLLIQKNSHVLTIPFGYHSLLYHAINNEKLELVKLLLTQSIDLNNSHNIGFDEKSNFVNNCIGPTPLLFALEKFMYDVSIENEKNMIEIIQLLVENKAVRSFILFGR
jgi:hypothetical protein